MQENKSFFELDNEGVIRHVHSDGYHIHLVYEDTEDDKLFRLLLDKDYMIRSAAEITTPCSVADIHFKKWTRPGLDSYNEVVFKGSLKTPTTSHKFSIGTDELVFDNNTGSPENFGFGSLGCLKNIQVDSHVQKGNLLYVIGWNEVSNEQVFIETHIGEDKARRRYVLASEKGNLILHSINVDPWCNRIYLGGELVVIDNETQCKPYLETLCYNKPPA